VLGHQGEHAQIADSARKMIGHPERGATRGSCSPAFQLIAVSRSRTGYSKKAGGAGV
jgi:hypothetical protein